MMAPRMPFIQAFSAMPPLFVRTSARPSGRPKTSEISPDAPVIRIVSQRERSRRLNMIGVIAKDLHPRRASLQKLQNLVLERRVAHRDSNEEPRHRLVLDMVNTAVDEPERLRQ